MDLHIGSRIGDYEVLGILGAGGMGKVYKVRNLISDRLEAMKVLLPDLRDAPELADRFLREIKVQAALEHPNIAALHTALRIDNQLLMLMEFIEGVTLEQKLAQGPLAVGEAVSYMVQALSALEYAHSHDVIHRDIKPANMMLTPSGAVKLMDFGIAKAVADKRLTATGLTVGSLYYMPPEQIQGAANLDARADLYSAGVTLYELVTGRKPFEGNSQFAIMAAHLAGSPVPPITLDPKLPRALNDAILRAVAKNPGDRFQSAAAFRTALQNLAAHPAAVERANGAAAHARSAHGRRFLWIGVGGATAAAAVIAAIQLAPPRLIRAAPPPSIPHGGMQVDLPRVAPSNPAAVVTAPESRRRLARPGPTNPGGGPALPAQASPGEAGSGPAVPPTFVQPAANQPAADQPAANQPAANQLSVDPANQEKLREIRDQFVMLNVRANGIRGTLSRMQSAQAAGGLGLNSSLQEPADLMNAFLADVTAALQGGDAAAAKSSLEKAERQVEKLEGRLNR